MLPKINRLKKKKDFAQIFKRGKGIKEDFLYLKWVFNDLKISRFGFIISQKVSKKAAIRNRIRRRLREIVRLTLPEIKRGIDGAIIAQPGLEKKDYREIEETIKRLFKKARLYKR